MNERVWGVRGVQALIGDPISLVIRGKSCFFFPGQFAPMSRGFVGGNFWRLEGYNWSNGAVIMLDQVVEME